MTRDQRRMRDDRFAFSFRHASESAGKTPGLSPLDSRWGLTTSSGLLMVFPSKADGNSMNPTPLLHGTLDLLILRTLTRGPMHGYGIAERLKQVSQDVLQVGESSLYPALQRLLMQGWVRAEWGASDHNRRARFYTLTASGRRQLAAEREEFERMMD